MPDPLYKKSKSYEIKTNILEDILICNQNAIINEITKNFPSFKLNYNDKYILLRRILPRENEYLEKNAKLKSILAHIYISKNVFLNLIQYFGMLLKQFRNCPENSIIYFQHYAKIQNTLENIRMLSTEYQSYNTNLVNKLSNTQGIWFVDLPFPKKILDLVSDAMLELKNGKLSVPLLRSYLEINIYIILENTINYFLSQSKSKKYANKKILFNRRIEFSDLIDLIKKFNIYSEKDIDVISRIQDYTSKSIHIGTFFDQITSWYMMSYLSDLTLNQTSISQSIVSIVKDYLKKGKFIEIDKDDNLTDYSRFQPISNQRK